MYRNSYNAAHAYGAVQLLNMADDGGEERPRDPEGPVSFADLGIPQPPKLRDTLLGKARRFQDTETNERVYVFVAVITLLATFAFTVYKIATVSSKDPDFTFALVLLVSTLFCAYYVIHGVLQERETEILIFSIATFIVLVYLIVNYAAGRKDSVKLGRLIVAAVLCPGLIGFGVWLSFGYYHSGNLIFRMVGANSQLQSMCRLLFLFFDCLKFDLQLAISMVILIVVSRLNFDTEDIIVLSVGGFITIVWFFLGYYTMKREVKIGAIIFFVFSPLEIGYVIFKLVQVADYIDTYKGLAGSTIACGIMALVVRVLVIIIAFFVFRNFNQGLKEKAFDVQDPAPPQPGQDLPEP